jgi:hypothetical protein
MARKLRYHDHGPATECSESCPYFAPAIGFTYTFSMQVKTRTELGMTNGMGIANAIVAELQRQSGIKQITYQQLELVPYIPPFFTGDTVTVGSDGSAVKHRG